MFELHIYDIYSNMEKRIQSRFQNIKIPCHHNVGVRLLTWKATEVVALRLHWLWRTLTTWAVELHPSSKILPRPNQRRNQIV